MAKIDTLSDYNPKLGLPLYTRIVDKRQNDYTVGEEYEMRIDDPERSDMRGQEGPYNYVHETILIAKHDCQFRDVGDVLLAFDTHSESREEAKKRVSPGDVVWEDDKDVSVLVFLRKDTAQEFVLSDQEIIPRQFNKHDAEAETEI